MRRCVATADGRIRRFDRGTRGGERANLRRGTIGAGSASERAADYSDCDDTRPRSSRRADEIGIPTS